MDASDRIKVACRMLQTVTCVPLYAFQTVMPEMGGSFNLNDKRTR